MSESTGLKTWGDVIKREANGDCHAISPVGMTPVNPGIESVASLVAQIGQSKVDTLFSLAPGTSAIVCRWLYLGCPLLADPIQPEADEPVAKVVRWEPTREQEGLLYDVLSRDSSVPLRQRKAVLEWLRDCQRDLPEVDDAPEPPMPEDAKSQRIDKLERLLSQIGDYAHDKSTGPTVEDGYWEIRSMAYDGLRSDLPPTPPTDRIAEIESRLAALESRSATPTPATLPRPTIVCLCGSTRFYEHFQRANYDETNKGNIVLSIGFYPGAPREEHQESLGCTPEQKIALDELYFRKIELADEILVLNVGGYVGYSTGREIEYAKSLGKVIRWLETPKTPVTPPAPVDGWQTEPPTMDCPCWIETIDGLVLSVAWHGYSGGGYSQIGTFWATHEITHYYPCPKPLTSPNPIGRSAYNTPTTFAEALTVEPQVAPEPEIPLPEGCEAIEGFPLLCMDENNNAWTRRQRRYVLPWVEDELENMKAHGYSDAEIKQSARYAIEQIAKDAGLDVVTK